MQYRNYTLDQCIEAVRTSFSKAQVLKKLGLAPRGGNYSTITKTIEKYNLDTSHFKGQGWNAGLTTGPKRPIEEYLSNKQTIKSYSLKHRLLSEGLFTYQCSSCLLKTWLDKPIPLELEHKDGNHFNNSLDNLCLLCPNCHALTPTYRGKNIGATGGSRTLNP